MLSRRRFPPANRKLFYCLVPFSTAKSLCEKKRSEKAAPRLFLIEAVTEWEEETSESWASRVMQTVDAFWLVLPGLVLIESARISLKAHQITSRERKRSLITSFILNVTLWR